MLFLLTNWALSCPQLSHFSVDLTLLAMVSLKPLVPLAIMTLRFLRFSPTSSASALSPSSSLKCWCSQGSVWALSSFHSPFSLSDSPPTPLLQLLSVCSTSQMHLSRPFCGRQEVSGNISSQGLHRPISKMHFHF